GAALDYLHEQRVVHRDVKPKNLLRRNGYAKVADFGLVRLTESRSMEATHMAGTALYMAPEVWNDRVCHASDQYSLAATYAEMRTGRPMFAATNFVHMGQLHLQGTPDLGKLPAAEQAVLSRALAKDPGERYATCSEFVAALKEACLPPPTPSVEL